MAIIGLIFARGGSKSIPNKNLQYLKKNRLLDIAILDLKYSNLCESICISSDSELILEAANIFEINQLKRPSYLAEDNSSEIYSWKHAIDALNLSMDDILLITPTTSPLRTIKTMHEAVLKMKENENLDGIVGIMETSMHPMFNMVKKVDNKVILWDQNEERLINRQQGSNCFDVTTVCFCYRASSVKRMNNIFDGEIGFVEVSNVEGIDIDSPLDLEFARFLVSSRSNFLSSINKNYL